MSKKDNLPKFDKSKFSQDPYVKRVDKPWGYELHWVQQDRPYMGKLEHLKAGHRMSLQIHDKKLENWLIINGRGKAVWANNKGEMIETELKPGQGYSNFVGRKHRLVGITDCDIIEVSTPEIGTTYRLEDDYGRPDETPQQRAIERGGV